MEQVLLVSVILLGGVVALNLLLTFALVRRLQPAGRAAAAAPDPVGPPIGQPAPPLQAETLAGVPVSLATYAGRPLALLFVAPTCGPCRESLPAYEALGPKARQAGAQLVLVSTADAAATAAFVAEFDVRLPVIVTQAGRAPVLSMYHFHATPSYCLIDAAGTVQAAGYPSPDWGAWKTLIESWDRPLPRLGGLVPSEGR